jgi:hypothetical protein
MGRDPEARGPILLGSPQLTPIDSTKAATAAWPDVLLEPATRTFIDLRRSPMSTAQATSNKATFRRLHDVVNTGDAELISKAIDEVVEPDV